jgi:DNA-binding transcriptional LysR family regulator
MELRHLRYFTAVVQWKVYREASRHLYITQPSISEAVSDLESELGIKLFSRDGRVARLTPEGQVFYEEAIKTVAQAERSIATAHRAAKGEIGRLGIGFIGFAAYPFLSELLRKYKARHPEWRFVLKRMCLAFALRLRIVCIHCDELVKLPMQSRETNALDLCVSAVLLSEQPWSKDSCR